MEDFIDAEDMLDMLFDKKVNVLSYMPLELLRNIVSYLSEASDILAFHYVCSRLHAVMQEEFTWKKLCISQRFTFVHDEQKEWKAYFFLCNSIRNNMRKMNYQAAKESRQFFGANDKWLVQYVNMDEGGTCLEAITNDVATPLQDPNYIGRVLYHKLSKDTLLVGDRRNISLIDLEDGTVYDHILTFLNIESIAYEPRSKQVFAGMDDGTVKCWRDARAKITVGNDDPRYHTVDRPSITMKGHSCQISVLLVSVDCTDANQRLISGAIDGSIVVWRKVYENGHSYRKEHALAHSGPTVNLFSQQNLLISTDLVDIRVWDLITGELLHVLAPPQPGIQKTTSGQDLNNSPTKQKDNNKTDEEKESQQPVVQPKYLNFVSESYGRVAATSQGSVYVWNVKTGELSHSFSLDLTTPDADVRGLLLSSCYLFVFPVVGNDVHMWNVVSGERIHKWPTNDNRYIPQTEKYSITMRGSGATSSLIVASISDGTYWGPHYYEFRVSVPRPRFQKRKREALRS